MYRKISLLVLNLFAVYAYAQNNSGAALLDNLDAKTESEVSIKNNNAGNSVRPVIMVSNKPSPTTTGPVVEAPANIVKSDNTAAYLAKLNQDYQIAQAQQRIDQLQNGGHGGVSTKKEKGKTVVTGVMINQSGNKLATLRFPDGGTLDVEIGTIIKNMKVTDISMNGVSMTSIRSCKGRGCKTAGVFYERVYDAPQYSGTNTQVQNGVSQPTSFAPYSSNSMVPPIITSN